MKKPAIIAATTAITVAGAAIIYLSQTVFKYYNIKHTIDFSQNLEQYPYAGMEIPRDFKRYSLNGIDFEAPDDLIPKDSDEVTSISTALLADADNNGRYTLQVYVSDVTSPIYPAGYELGSDGFFNSCIQDGMDKLGYSVPENFHDLILLLNTMKPDDCNIFSPTEVRTFKKLTQFKSTMVPSVLSIDDKNCKGSVTDDIEKRTFIYDNENMKSFITQTKTKYNNFELMLECYADDDLNKYQLVVIQGNNIDTVRQVAQTVTKTEL